jgi:predicted nucleic acid-binding protein
VKDLLFDADAFLFIRKLSILRLLVPLSGRWLMTSYIARHELNDIADEITEFEKAGHLLVQATMAKDPLFRKLKKEGHHVGEAEAIAWAAQLAVEERPIFISADKGARDGARTHGVPAGDLMDLVVEAIESGEVDRRAVREKVAVWDDKHQMLGRPSDYTTFDDTFEKRRQARDMR